MKIRLIFSFGEYDENDLLLIKQKLIEKINFLIKKYNGETIELNNLIKIERKKHLFVKVPDKYGYDFLTEFRYPLKIELNELEDEKKSVSLLEKYCSCSVSLLEKYCSCFYNPVKYEIMVYSDICYV